MKQRGTGKRMELPARPVQGHKALFGKVLIVGGSEGMIGAAAFAAMAALRMGCGLAYVASDGRVLGQILGVIPEAVGIAVRTGREARFVESVSRCDAVVVGPGLGQGRLSAAMVRRAIEGTVRLVVDADALNLVAGGAVELRRERMTTVLTPHPGEMARLGGLFGGGEVADGEASRIELARAAAKHFGQVVILKGKGTVISDGERFAVNRTGDSTLSKAGSGDVLSGMIGTLLAQGMDLFEAARLGAHVHGLAGELAGKKLGRRCALARDVIEAIPEAVRRVEKGR